MKRNRSVVIVAALIIGTPSFAQQLLCPSNNSASCSTSGDALTVTNTNTGSSARAGFFDGNSACSAALVGNNDSTGFCGELPVVTGVKGVGTHVGVSGNGGTGVEGLGSGTGSVGVYGTGVANGVLGASTDGIAVRGDSINSNGVHGTSTHSGSSGVFGENLSNGWGVAGRVASTGTNWAVLGDAQSTTGKAGRFVGAVSITGSISKGSGSFKIDHPLDPENKYLYHSFVESPDMKNIYDGTIVLDSRGEANVVMPEWFSALNQDFRYQLTPIGVPANLFIAAELRGNQFKIAGGKPGQKVSWQVTGIRHDAFAEQARIPVEEVKPSELRGTFLHPTAWGRSESRGEDYKLLKEVRGKRNQGK